MLLPISGDKGDSIKVSYLHHLDQLKKSAAVVDITRKFSANQNTITVGGSFAIDPLTQAKVRFNNYGKLGGMLQHEIFPKSVLTISGEVDTKALDKNPKFGLAIDLKPWSFPLFLKRVIEIKTLFNIFWVALEGRAE